jgi:CheY-like chemotaxis protein
VGEGSTFYVTLPLVREEPLLAPAPESRRPLVLVCDDDPSIREVVGGVLEQKGYRVLTAATGAEAIEVAAAEQPSTILLDLIMPGLSGGETISALKANPATREIPVIILSGLRPVEDEAVNASADDWVTKPFDEESLFAIVERAVNGHARTARILVVEDDHDLAQVITTTFRTRGIETHHARTGREAIDLSQKVDPHLIILDLVLPEGDGYTVVDWLRRHNALRNVPLVVYSVKEPSAEEREHLKLGRTEFLTKGRLAPEEFERCVIDLLDHVIPNQKKETTDREHEESADHRG